MARLNEEAAPTEHLDEFRREEARKHAKDREWMRELMRKNRQLVEDNKVKSITIRGLNDEIARLRAQNLVLREDVIKLRLEMRKRPSQDRVRKVSDSLRQKLDALQDVLVELDTVQEPLLEKPQTPAREWKREQRARVSIHDDPTKLPTIREDKMYPRHSDSPGTPPVTTLDAAELIVEEDNLPESHIPEAGTVNLETRRKRRDASQKLDIKKIPIFQSPPKDEEQHEPTKARKPVSVPKDTDDLGIPKSRKLSNPIRAGSKRKISPLEEDAATIKDPIKAPDSSAADEYLQQPASPSPKPSLANAQSPSIRPRQALSTKSINMSPTPPTAIPLKKTEIIKETLKDTPPPTTNSLMDGAPSLNPTRVRRARPTVNYAEPNLVSKMRRPESRLIDAVGPDSRRDGETPDRPRTSTTSSHKRSHSAVDMRSDDAQAVPGSPLDDRRGSRVVVGVERVVKDCREGLEKEREVAREKKDSTVSAAAGLTSETGIRKPRAVSGSVSKLAGATTASDRARRRKSALI